MSRELLYVEMDLPKCPLVCGTAPCEAVFDTGEQCKNTPATCLDLANYATGEIQTVRWVKSAAYVPIDPYAVPNLMSVSCNSQRINPGENLGKRERVTAVFSNHRSNDSDLDPYVSTRNYNPFERGTYWGKFYAMYPNIQGYPVRVLRGNDETDYSEFETSHYIADVGKIAGDNTGYSLVAKDVLDFAEGNKTLLPTPSNGLLASAITAATATVNLVPSGIGDLEYPATFHASIGDECVSCTRVGDTVTFTQRGFLFTQPADHDDGDTLQIIEAFEGESVSEILARLLYATNTPAAYYDTDAWELQEDIVTAPNLTAYIAEPTEVFKLIQDLMIDMALDIHTDVIRKKVVMRFLQGQSPVMEITDGNMDDPSAKFFEDKRIDLYFMSFGRRNPLEKMDEGKNYPMTMVRQTESPVSLISGNPAAIKRTYSRWIPSTLRTQASKTAEFMIYRYDPAPRGLTCTMKSTLAPELGQVVNVTTSVFEDYLGRVPTIPMQVVSLSKGQGNYRLELEEFRAKPVTPGDSVITVTLLDDLLNMGIASTMRDIYNAVYPGPIPPDSIIRFEAEPGVVFGSNSVSEFAVIMGDWPEVAADNVTIQILGLFIAGRGGDGGSPGYDGENGGPAFYTRVPVNLIACTIGGGGGGGGGIQYRNTFYNWFYLPGGGGAGSSLGNPVNGGNNSIGSSGYYYDEFGAEYYSGNGGNLGDDGTGGYAPEITLGNPDLGDEITYPETSTVGGSAGIAVDGDSFLTLDGLTTIFGARIN